MFIARRYASTAKNSSALMRAQLDIGGIVKNHAAYTNSILRRQTSPEIMENLEFIKENRPIQLELSSQVNAYRHERSNLGESMKKNPSSDVKLRLLEIKNLLKPLEAQEKALTVEIYTRAESLPNLLDPSVPKDPLEGQISRLINCNSEQDAETSSRNTLGHKEIGERLGIMDFTTASRVSGSSWYYLIGDGALLEQALVQYALSKARKLGYKMVIPPSIVRSDIINACGFKPNDQNGEKQIYQLEGEETALTGTAEIPLGALHSSSIFDQETVFPLKYVGISRAYRAEAGARGKDTKGLYRVHEFTKVELFHFTTPEISSEELENIKDLQADIIHELGLSAKMINMPTTDLGSPAMKKYDCESWMPGRGGWGELTSCSNCGDYQSRRLGIRYYGKDSAVKHVHTLNGTAMAVPRVIVAIMEQNYDPETESIIIPPVLRPFMDDKEYIIKN